MYLILHIVVFFFKFFAQVYPDPVKKFNEEQAEQNSKKQSEYKKSFRFFFLTYITCCQQALAVLFFPNQV